MYSFFKILGNLNTLPVSRKLATVRKKENNREIVVA